MLRFDATTESWVILAPDRAARPRALDPLAPAAAGADAECPFCPGNEAATPPEIHAVRDRSGAWRVRVVGNRFPALRSSPAAPDPAVAPFVAAPGYGAHEVVIESPEHGRALREQPIPHWVDLLRVLRDRERALAQDERLRAVSTFKNHGPAAGASLPHPHWQILATPVVPALLERRAEVSRRHHERTGGSLAHELLDAERAAAERVVEENERFVSFLPFASRFPYETWVQPLRRVARFADCDDASLPALAEMLRGALARLAAVLGDPAFNLVLMSAPRAPGADAHFAFQAQLWPRLAHPAGFELGSGAWINTKRPEVAAAELRAAVIAGWMGV